MLLVVAAAALGVGAALAGLAYAILTLNTVRQYRDLGTAADWLLFVGTGTGLAAVSVTAWDISIQRGWQQAGELFGAVAASLVVAIGTLVVAANAPGGSNAGSVVSAVGIGGWAVLTLIAAARRSIAEQSGAPGRQSDLWLIATGALVVLAVAVGLPSPSARGRALPIAESVLFLVAFAVLAATLHAAAGRGFFTSRRLRILNLGLAGLAVSHLAAAISSGFVFGPSAGLTTVRVGLSIPAFLEAIAWAIVTLAAFRRFADLSIAAGPILTSPSPAWSPNTPTETRAGSGWVFRPRRPTPPPAPPPWASPPPPPNTLTGEQPPDPTVPIPEQPPTEQVPAAGPVASHCGVQLPAGAAFCPRCGQPVSTPGAPTA